MRAFGATPRARGQAARAGRRAGCSPGGPAADPGGMWNYVLRHRVLLRAIYARSTADA